MPLSLLFASDTLDLYLDQENEWLYLDWKGSQTLEQVRVDCQRATEYFYQSGVHKALNDNSRVTDTSWEMMHWVASEFLPEMGRNGLEYLAWVYGPVLGCRSDLDLMSNFLGPHPQVAFFEDVAAAYEWLASVHAPARH
jgi:hypothetical protein